MCWNMRPNPTQPMDGPNPCPSLMYAIHRLGSLGPSVILCETLNAVGTSIDSAVGSSATQRGLFVLLSQFFYVSIAEWLACWSQTQKARVQIALATLSGNSFRQTVHTHCASVHQAAKLVAAVLRVVGVTAGLSESNGNLPLGL